MTIKISQDEVLRHHQSPATIRNRGFGRRMRGLDEDEVLDYLDVLADQVEAAESELRAIQADNERLRAQLEGLSSTATEHDSAEARVNDQVVELFSQAQLVAEEMVEEVSREARQRLGQARAQERQILEEAMETAERTLKEAEAKIMRTLPAPTNGHSSRFAPGAGEADQVRSFARQAQAQMQSIMEAFAEQVERLGDTPRANGRDPWGAA